MKSGNARSKIAGTAAFAFAALFAGTVSSLFPAANLVAIDRFGAHGPSLGAYRSAQIGIGAAAGWLIGQLGESVGLRATLLIAVVSPALLVVFLRPPTSSRPVSLTSSRSDQIGR